MNRQHSSTVERCFCNAMVVGSNPTAGLEGGVDDG